MNIRTTLAMAGLLLLALPAPGASPGTFFSDRFRFEPSGDAFPPNEIRYDLYGTWAGHRRKDANGDHAGLGIGATYYFNRYLGVGAQTYLESFDWPNHLDANVIGRYPIMQTGFAPYGLGGFGRQFNLMPQWTFHIGGGLEFRLNDLTSVFVDIRRVFPDKSPDFTLWRFGVGMGF